MKKYKIAEVSNAELPVHGDMVKARGAFSSVQLCSRPTFSDRPFVHKDPHKRFTAEHALWVKYPLGAQRRTATAIQTHHRIIAHHSGDQTLSGVC